MEEGEGRKQGTTIWQVIALTMITSFISFMLGGISIFSTKADKADMRIVEKDLVRIDKKYEKKLEEHDDESKEEKEFYLKLFDAYNDNINNRFDRIEERIK